MRGDSQGTAASRSSASTRPGLYSLHRLQGSPGSIGKMGQSKRPGVFNMTAAWGSRGPDQPPVQQETHLCGDNLIFLLTTQKRVTIQTTDGQANRDLFTRLMLRKLVCLLQHLNETSNLLVTSYPNLSFLLSHSMLSLIACCSCLLNHCQKKIASVNRVKDLSECKTWP